MNERGFSLMELMITVVIIGILAAIAIPAYTGHVTRTRRSEAVTGLQTIALYQEKAMAESGQYVDLGTLVGTGSGHYGMTDPNGTKSNYVFDTSPSKSSATLLMNDRFVAYARPKFDDKVGADKKTLCFVLQSDGKVGKFLDATAVPAFGTLTVDDELWKNLRP